MAFELLAYLKQTKFFGFIFIAILTYMAYFPGPIYSQENYKIKHFEIQGVREVSESEMREALVTKKPPWTNNIFFWKEYPLFNAVEFQLDLRRILKFYRLKGFYHTTITDRRIDRDDDKREVRIFVKLDEGNPTRITKITLAPADSSVRLENWPSLHRRLLVKADDLLSDDAIQNNRLRLTNYFANDGYPYARVTPETVRDDQNKTAELKFYIDPGKRFVFGDRKITGTKKYPQRVITKQISLKKGDPYNQSKLVSAQQQIYQLELFQSVRIKAEPQHEDSEEIPIQIEVREAPLRTLKTGLGWGTEDKFRATVNARRRNFLGDARRLEAEIKYSSLEPGRFKFSIQQPHFPWARTSFQLSPFFIRQKEENFEVERLGTEILMQRGIIDRYTNGYLSYRFEGVDADTMNIRTRYQKSILTFGLVRNTSRPIFSPTRGTFRSLVVDWSGFLLNADFNYLKTTIEYRRYAQIFSGIVLANRLKAGHVFLLGDRRTSAPPEELFYAGGSSSVRGWQRFQLGPKSGDNPAGGRSLFEGSIEFRIPIWGELSSVLFTDFGNIWKGPFSSLSDRFLKDLHHAAGLGLRYNTPIGPARFDLAWKLNKQTRDEKRMEFHLSIGHAF